MILFSLMYCFVECLIPTKEKILIESLEKPEHIFTHENELIRLKKDFSAKFEYNNPNLLELILKNGKYLIKSLDSFLCRNLDDDILVVKDLDLDEQGFFLDIILSESGIKIVNADKCLSVYSFDDEYEGYLLKFLPCSTTKNQDFLIRRPIIRIKDNESPMNKIIEFSSVKSSHQTNHYCNLRI